MRGPKSATSRVPIGPIPCERPRRSFQLFDDGVNAASPFVAREAHCELKRCAHQRHSENSDQSRCASEARSGQGQTTAEATQNIIFGDADFLEVELRQEVRTVPHGIDRTLED